MTSISRVEEQAMRILGDGESFIVEGETPGLKRHRDERGDFNASTQAMREQAARNLAHYDAALCDALRAARRDGDWRKVLLIEDMLVRRGRR
jgi:hypothetical protein